MLNEIFSWWCRQMLALIPERYRNRDSGPAQALVLAWDEAADSAELLTRRDGRETSLGRFALDETGLRMARAMLGGRRAPATVLRLPPGLLLERQVVLPLAAEQGLDRVVRYEMDRFTPFAADEVFWSCTIRHRDRAQGKLSLAIALVPRVRLQSLLAAVAHLRLAPGLLEAVGFGGAVRRIPLGERDMRGERRRRRMLVVGGAACAALAVVAVALPFWLQSGVRDGVEARIAGLKPRVAEAEALRRQMAASAEGSDVISAEHARVGDVLQAIAALTEILGDDTYLVGLVMQKRQVTLEGQASAAAKLIAALSADPTIRNASFSAPVMRSETGSDLFSIRAEFAP